MIVHSKTSPFLHVAKGHTYFLETSIGQFTTATSKSHLHCRPR